MQILIFIFLMAGAVSTSLGVDLAHVSDVVPYFSHPGQGSHTRLGGSAHQAGLLYQQSPITIKLTGETVVIRQEVNFDILNKKMATLNHFQESVTTKIESLQNMSVLSLEPIQRRYSIEPQVNLLKKQLNKSLHNSHSNLMYKHSRFCLQQQEIMQKILQTQQYEQTFIATSIYPSIINRQKRALPFLLAKLIAGISTIATSKIFTFAKTITTFASFAQLLEHAHDTYGTVPDSYSGTPQLEELFDDSNQYTREPRFFNDTNGQDIALGHYTNELSTLFNEHNLTGIKQINFLANPSLKLTSFMRPSRWHTSIANSYEQSKSRNSHYAKHSSKYIMEVANKHLDIMSGIFHAEAITRDIMLEVEEINHLTDIIYDQAHLELSYVTDFINHITEQRTIAQSFIYKTEWNRLRQDNNIPQHVTESLTHQMNKVIPTLVFSHGIYQIHYTVALLKEKATFLLSNSKHVPFNSNLGQLILDHQSTSKLTSKYTDNTFIIPSEQLDLCTSDKNTLYCSANILETGLDPCITSITDNIPDNILENCALLPTKRRNTALRLTPSMIYYDQNHTMAIQKCESMHSFPLKGQGTFTIPPACSLTFNGATFKNNEPNEINHHQPQQPTPILTFSDSAIFDNEIDFPNQRPSFVTKNESIIAHAVLVLFIAILTLLTKIIYAMTARYTNNTNRQTPADPDPEIQNTAPSAPTPEQEHVMPEQNIQMYPRHSRILSPFDIENQFNSYK